MTNKKEKEFYVRVKTEWAMSVFAKNEKEAKQIIRQIIEDQHNIALEEHEFLEITEQKVDETL